LARDHRRLAAIVSLDVAEYSRLMGVDDSGTLAALKAHRRELIDPKIAEYDGRIVKTTGDGLLLEFPSVVDAVRCAVDVQRGMAERNSGIAPNQRLDFRIGINVGDIIIDGDDIFGDGVNVAARLEAVADPGGICVSRVVRDQVLDKLSFTFEDLGARQVKNIARPVDVFRVELGSGTPQAQRSSGRRFQGLKRGPPWRWPAAGILALGLAAVGMWLLPQLFRTAPLPSPPTGSFAVLPLATSANPADGQLAETLTVDLTSALKRSLPEWPVVAHTLAVTYMGRAVDPRQVGRELNVRYLVEGDVRTDGERTVVKARLIEASQATEVWSDEIGHESSGAGQDRRALIALLTAAVKNALIDAERRRVLAQPVGNLSASDLALRADAIQQNNPASLTALAESRMLFDEALRRDPTLTEALMGQALTLGYLLDVDPHADHDRLVREYEEMSARVVAVAEREARAWNIRADALQRAWRWEAALEANAKAQQIDPTRINTIGQRAQIMVDMGRPREALALVDRALSLQPANALTASYLANSNCRANMALGHYDDAIAACERSASLGDSWSEHVYLVAAYSLQGNSAKAQVERTKLLTQRPGLSISELKALKTSDVPEYLQQIEAHLYAGLRKAGIPEN